VSDRGEQGAAIRAAPEAVKKGSRPIPSTSTEVERDDLGQGCIIEPRERQEHSEDARRVEPEIDPLQSGPIASAAIRPAPTRARTRGQSQRPTSPLRKTWGVYLLCRVAAALLHRLVQVGLKEPRGGPPRVQMTRWWLRARCKR